MGDTWSINDALLWANAIDNIDGEVEVFLDSTSLNSFIDQNNLFTTEGTYKLIYSATDSSNNVATKSIFINVTSLKYDVTFDLDYDNLEPIIKSVNKDNTVLEEIVSNREGHDFIGWFHDGDLFDFDTPINSDITLIARWNTKVYKLTLSNGLESDQTNDNIIFYDTLVTLTIYTYEGLLIESLIINDVDVTEEIDNNVYQFTLTSNTTAILTYDYIVTSSEFKSKEQYGSSVLGGSGTTEVNVNNYLTLNDPNLNVIYKKNNSGTHSIFNNSANETRLYPGSKNGGSLLIIVDEGYEIVKVLIETASTNAGFSVNDNGNYTYTKSSETITFSNPINSVEIKNIADATSGTSNQVQIQSITIMYKEIGNTIDFIPPELTIKEDAQLMYEFTDQWNEVLVYDMFDVWDNVDEDDVVIDINTEEIDNIILNGYFSVAGTYNIYITATDSSGNISTLTIKVRVFEDLGALLVNIDYKEYDNYYEDLDNIYNDTALIEAMAFLLRDTILYQKYDAAKTIYAYYDNGNQVVFYDYDGRDNSYQHIQPSWGSGGYVTLTNSVIVKLEREHVWACSDMLIKPINGSKSNKEYVGYDLNLDKEFDYRPDNDNYGHYSDLHNLWLSIGSANGTHSNHFYGEENGPSDAYYLANNIFYPGEEYIGDIARILFYMTLMYPHLELVVTGDENAVEGSIYYGYLDILLYWNEIDPPSDYEIARNELIFKTQGNRNPFIDFYEDGFAESIFSYGDPNILDN